MDPAVTRIALPAPVRAAASDGVTVWCADAHGVRAYTAAGAPFPSGAPLPSGGAVPSDGGDVLPRLRSLAAVPGTVAGTAGVPGTLPETVVVPRSLATAPIPVPQALSGTLAATARGRVHWLAPDGTPLATARCAGRVVAGGGEIWAVSGARARRLTGPGTLGPPVDLPGLAACAVEGERLWWTSRHDDVLRGGPRDVDLGVLGRHGERGGMTVCAGSLWISVPGGLLRISTWSGEPGRFVAAPAGPVPFLACANGTLVGGGHDLFALAPAAGAALRVIPSGLDAPIARLVAAGKHVWAFPQGAAHALIVTL
ncbi:hypothetical protein Nocox_18480 [Nonomuraea coxensis DSM 45129]|uniref:Uncharacterized protein n=1 Tax=Nonomuraea coxensis DSM 45129 TaxID=1122611 RepID=A0ABX8U0N2_9ACTN|nr:hypothetical protein [Nonomuraea coxensis]QYC41305.1 hypothetical protein Nocox_18480 [Nonomuraea coxensis DSM 45129]